MHAAFVEKLFRNCYIIFHESHSGTTVSRVAAPVFSRHSRVNFRTVVRANADLFEKKGQQRKKYIVFLCIANLGALSTGTFFKQTNFSFFRFAAIRI